MKKINRGLKNQEFQTIIKKGKSAANAHYVVYSMPAKFENSRVGISVGKKIGGAVARNKIKRQVREIVKNIIDFDQKNDYIVIVRNNFVTSDFDTRVNEFKLIYKKISGGTRNANETKSTAASDAII